MLLFGVVARLLIWFVVCCGCLLYVCDCLVFLVNFGWVGFSCSGFRFVNFLLWVCGCCFCVFCLSAWLFAWGFDVGHGCNCFRCLLVNSVVVLIFCC